MRTLSILFLLFGLSGHILFAQQTTTTIRGSWMEFTGETGMTPEPGRFVVRLYEVTTGGLLQKQELSETGTFVFHDVPFGSYRLDLEDREVVEARSFIRVRSAQPVAVEMGSGGEWVADEVVVTSQRFADRQKTQTSTVFTSSRINSLPIISPEKSIEAVLINTPGVVPDEDGRFHIRGEDAQLQYVVDGIPVTANMTRIYGSLFDTRLVSSMEIETGALDAEYGVATSGVVLINTRSGFDAPQFLRASGSYGSFNTFSGSLQGGGRIGEHFSGMVAAGISGSDRYLDPISGFEPIHDQGNARHLFVKGDWVGTGNPDISTIFLLNRTEFEIPNGKITEPSQDQRQILNDHLLGLRAVAILGERSVLSGLLYWRKGTVEVTSGRLSRLESQEDYDKAIAENEKFFIGLERTNESFGGDLDFSLENGWFGGQNIVKVGAGAEIYPLDEFFTFAITNPALSDSDTAGGDGRLVPYDLTRGGNPFVVDRQLTGKRISGFVQDQLTRGKLRVSAGLRFDHFDLLDQETFLSPRLSVAYALSETTTLRGSYNRIVMRAPVENILVSSSSQAETLSGEEQGGVPVSVRSEKAHVVEIDADFLLSDYLSITAAAYGKSIDDFLVKAELGNSGIIFPINLRKGLVIGGEISTSLREWHHLSALLTMSGGIAYGLVPEDGSSPVAAGLIIGEEGYFYSHPFSEEDHFPTEHSQLFEASLNLHYSFPAGFFAVVGGRFDSGLPFDLVDENGKGLNPEESRQELRNRGYSDDVIDLLNLESERPGSPDKSVAPHGTIDLAAGVDLDQLMHTHTHARLTATITNVLDTPYLYKFESSFGGTHFGQPRMGAVSLEVEL